ncbi:PH domain-containing protein [Companilactobacillus mishanensis]|uniref:YdbS-like PH domain-containing protein n=1 Tax=Companilactobacillus mishanensis TaxID=2486008 RepID=A0A5P0ZJJ9_9LACO|nr:PH domain-containing protein [Companilactobacillus mishanensis]MQS53273.1 hypothetical protein [Companilactobacillus mishanensis]
MNKVEKLPADIKKIWRLNAYFDFFILFVVSAVFYIWKIFAPKNMQPALFRISLIILAIAIVIFIIELALVQYRWNFWTFYIDERQVELHHGYFFRKQIVIPIARVQNVTLKQGPILRLKDLHKVIVVTAAGSDEISGLKTSQANDLKELIMKLAKEARNDL